MTTRLPSIPPTMEVGSAARRHRWSQGQCCRYRRKILAGGHGFKYLPVAPTDTAPGPQGQNRWCPEAISTGLQTSKYSISGPAGRMFVLSDQKRQRRSYTPEYRIEAANLVISTGRSIGGSQRVRSRGANSGYLGQGRETPAPRRRRVNRAPGGRLYRSGFR